MGFFMPVGLRLFALFQTLFMSSLNRGVVYSLLIAVLVLLLGIAALLWVAYRRHQRLEDATLDLQRNVAQQEGQIKLLQRRLEDCDTLRSAIPVDSSWYIDTEPDSLSAVTHISRPSRNGATADGVIRYVHQ